MAIQIERTEDEQGRPHLKIDVDNGDLAALEDAISKWTFRDVPSMLRFTLAVLREAEGRVVYIDHGIAKKAAVAPADNLLNTNTEEGDTNATRPAADTSAE